MATDINVGQDYSKVVAQGTDLSASQFCIVKDDGNGNCVLAASATDVFLGILQNDPKAPANDTRVASYRAAGRSKVQAGAAIVAGNLLTSDGNGRAIPAGAGNRTIGVARESVPAPSGGSYPLVTADIHIAGGKA